MPTIDLSILNQRQTPAFYADVFANRPAAGFIGRIFVSTNTFELYRDNGTGWDLIGGAGTVTGSGLAGQVAYWDGASLIAGDPAFTFDKTTKATTFLGDIILDSAAATKRLILDADVNVARIFSIRANNLPRWAVRVDGTESGSDAGSDFAIRRYNDAGTFVDAPLTVTRSTGQSTFAKKVVIENNAGDQQLQIVSTTAPSLRFDNLQTGATKRAGLGISTAVNNFIQGSADRDFCMFNGSATASPILFGIYDAVAVNVQEAARITSTRNFLLGSTVDSGERLQVTGTSKFTQDIVVSGNNLGAKASGGTGNTIFGANTGVNFGGGVNQTVAIGNSALQSLTALTGNTAVGSFALQSITASTRNTAVGYEALQAFVGTGSLQSNTALGFQAGKSITGSDNTAFGSLALTGATTSRFNTAIGQSSLNTLTSGINNTALGYRAGSATSTGNNNIQILNTGYLSFSYTGITTGTGNSIIGFHNPANFLITTGSNNVVLGGGFTLSDESDALVLGNNSGAIKIYSPATNNVIIGTTTDNLTGLLQVNGAITANSFVKNSGTAAQILAADGTVITAGTNITISGGTISASGGGGSISLSAIGSTPNANAATLTGSVLNLEPASASFGGVVTTGGQTFAGAKTFNDGVTFTGTGSGVIINGASSVFAFNNTGHRIRANFSDVSLTNRLLFINGNANSNTNVGAIPAGIATTCQYITYNNSTPTNSSSAAVGVNNANAFLDSNRAGTGSSLPLALKMQGVNKVVLETNGKLSYAAGTTGNAQINLAASTAPTSPVDGDIWFDGTDMKIRIGGLTKTFTIV